MYAELSFMHVKYGKAHKVQILPFLLLPHPPLSYAALISSKIFHLATQPANQLQVFGEAAYYVGRKLTIRWPPSTCGDRWLFSNLIYVWMAIDQDSFALCSECITQYHHSNCITRILCVVSHNHMLRIAHVYGYISI